MYHEQRTLASLLCHQAASARSPAVPVVGMLDTDPLGLHFALACFDNSRYQVQSAFYSAEYGLAEYGMEKM